jgi:hypothetical protein
MKVLLKTPEAIRDQIWRELSRAAARQKKSQSKKRNFCILEQETQLEKPNKLKSTHFAVITADVMEIDWLELASSGHRRAKISLDSWKWLIP